MVKVARKSPGRCLRVMRLGRVAGAPPVRPRPVGRSSRLPGADAARRLWPGVGRLGAGRWRARGAPGMRARALVRGAGGGRGAGEAAAPPSRLRSLGVLAPGEAIGGRWVRADVLARGTGAGAGRRRRPWAGEAAPTPRPRALARWCRAPGAGDLGFLANFATTYADCSPITARLLGFGLRIPRSEKGSGGDYSIGAPYLA